MRARSRTLPAILADAAVLYPLAALVFLSPIPLASNRYWSWSLCALLAGLLMLIWLVGAAVTQRRPHGELSWLSIGLFLSALAWAWLQAQQGMPAGWVHPVWELAGDALAVPVMNTISVAPFDNATAIMRLLAYALVFYLAFQLGRDRHRARRAFWWIFIAGVIYSTYGLLSYWGILREFLWYQDDAFGRDVRATFANRNHFANWLGIAMMCSLAAFIDFMLRAPQVPMMSLQSRQKRFDRFMGRSWAPLAGLVLMTAALVSSHSRGGFIATFCGGFTLLWLIDRKLSNTSKRARAIALSALVVSALAFFITSEVLVDRFDRSGIDAEGRAKIYLLTSKGIADNGFLGFGYGAYEDGFRFYRDEEVTKRVDWAHNTFLENMFELGVPVALLLFTSVVVLAVGCLRGLRRRHRDWIYPATGVASTVLVAVHANIDFGLQIPATALLYAFVMGISCAQCYSKRPGKLRG